MNAHLMTIATAMALSVAMAGAQAAQKQELDGVRNFTRVDATVGCAGAVEVSAIPSLAKMGYRSIVNLRQSSEPGVAIEESKQAASAAGLTYIHLPFNASEPDPAVVQSFLAAVTDTANQPVFIHCGSANRVGAMWMAKRMLVDNWNEARALEEATAIGLSNAALRQFMLDYVAARRK